MSRHRPYRPPARARNLALLALPIVQKRLKSSRVEYIISEQEYAEILDKLGTEARELTSVLPKLSCKLYLDAVPAELLALTGVLHKVVEFFEVFLAPSAHLWFSQESTNRQRRNRVMEWLAGLTERVRRGLDNNTYRFIAAPHRFDRDIVDEGERQPSGLALQSILTLLSYTTRPGDVLWVDDRYTNGFFRRDAAPIVGMNEVLKAMVTKGVISRSRYFDTLIKMREADFRFVPFEGDEILYHLTKAVVDKEGVLVETHSLKVLRQYVARCLRDVKLLQWPPQLNPNSNAAGEAAFVLEISRAAQEVLITVWETEDDKVVRQARADWLLNFLWFDPWLVHLLRDSLPENEENQMVLAATGLVSLISHGQLLGRTSGRQRKDLRTEYREWLEHSVLNARFDAEPRLVKKVSEVLKSTMLSIYQDTFCEVSEDERPLYMAAFALWIDEYPERVRKSLERDTDFMEKMGRQVVQVVSLGRRMFRQEEFWPAAEKAVNGQKSTAMLIETEEVIAFIPSTTPDIAFFIKQRGRSERYPITEAPLTLLSHSKATQGQVLRTARDWFDCADTVREERIAAIVNMPEPRARAEQAAYWRNRSVSVQYAALVEHLAGRQPLQLDILLQPDAEAFLEHYRINSDTFESQPFSISLEEAASTLLREEGVYEAIKRLSRFPVPLPRNIFDALNRMEREEQRALVHELLTIIGSPLGLIHVTHILVYLSKNIPSCTRLARWLVRFAFKSELRVVFDAYFALLHWVFAAFSHRHARGEMSSRLPLALSWAHTDELFRVFVGANMSMEWLRSALPRFHRRVTHEIFERDLSVWFDIAHPHRLQRTTLLATGFAYCFNSDLGVQITEQLRGIFLEESFHQVDSDYVPTLALLSDPHQASNVLDSFLGGSRYEQLSLLLGADVADQFSHEALLNAVKVRLAEIREGQHQGINWLLLQLIIGDLPPDESIRAEFIETLYSTDYVRLFEDDPDAGLMALRAAMPHVVTSGDGRLYEHVSAAIAGVARHTNNEMAAKPQQGGSEFIQDRAHMLLEGAIYLAMAAKQKQEALEVFCNIVSRIVDEWRASAKLYLPIIQRFCRELPPARAKPLWRLLIRLRAE